MMPKLCPQSLQLGVLHSPRYQDRPHRGTAAVRENPGAKDTASRGRGCHKAKGLARYWATYGRDSLDGSCCGGGGRKTHLSWLTCP